jgi:diguanylate cyclase (GGDEF)-like protein
MQEEQSSAEITCSADFDLISAANIALVMHLLAWAVLVLASNWYKTETVLTLQLTWLLSSISLFRFLFGKLHTLFFANLTPKWMSLHYLLLLLHTLFWSSLFVLSLLDETFIPLQQTLLITIAVVSFVGVLSLRAKRWVAQLYASIIVLPAAFFAFYQPDFAFLGPVLAMFWCLLMFVSYQAHADYRLNKRQQHQLGEYEKTLSLLQKTDSLTKIYNRQYFTDCFEYQWQLAIRNDNCMALLRINIDEFRRVNEVHGDAFGDECLIAVSDLIRQSAKRNTDMVVRYGGAEFMLILPDTEPMAALKLAKLIRRNIEEFTVLIAGKTEKLTVCIGVGVVQPSQFSSPTVLLQKAEMALFSAKQKSINCVEIL